MVLQLMHLCWPYDFLYGTFQWQINHVVVSTWFFVSHCCRLFLLHPWSWRAFMFYFISLLSNGISLLFTFHFPARLRSLSSPVRVCPLLSALIDCIIFWIRPNSLQLWCVHGTVELRECGAENSFEVGVWGVMWGGGEAFEYGTGKRRMPW